MTQQIRNRFAQPGVRLRFPLGELRFQPHGSSGMIFVQPLY